MEPDFGVTRRTYGLMTNGNQFQWRWKDNGQPYSPIFDTIEEAKRWRDPTLLGTFVKVIYADGWELVEE